MTACAKAGVCTLAFSLDKCIFISYTLTYRLDPHSSGNSPELRALPRKPLLTIDHWAPPQSGPTAVRTFYVEQGRWSENGRGQEFGNAASPTLAPKAVRGNAKI